MAKRLRVRQPNLTPAERFSTAISGIILIAAGTIVAKLFGLM